MTTVVLHQGTLAWDSQLSFGDCKTFGDKARRLPKGGVVVVYGDVDVLDDVAACVADGGDPVTVVGREDDSTGVVVAGRRGVFLTNGGRTIPLRGPWAAGSGAMAAMAGIAMGLSAKESCELACKVDLFSGGEVKTYRVPSTKA